MNHHDCPRWSAASFLSSGLDQTHERGLKAAASAGSNYFQRRIRPSTEVPRPRSPTEEGSGTVRNPRTSPPPLFAVWMLMYHLPARSSASFVSALTPKTVSRSTSGFVKTPPVTALEDRVRLTRTPAVWVKPPPPLGRAVAPWMWELFGQTAQVGETLGATSADVGYVVIGNAGVEFPTARAGRERQAGFIPALAMLHFTAWARSSLLPAALAQSAGLPRQRSAIDGLAYRAATCQNAAPPEYL